MLEIESLCVCYGKMRALEDVNLRMASGASIHGIIGPNGAGKSTLMDAITGRTMPTRGRVCMNGVDLTRRSVVWRRRHGMARSFQRTSIFAGLSVREQLELVASQLGERDLCGIVGALDLGAIYEMAADSIAYGDQRRIDIALSLIGHPKLILLDEPAAGLSTVETMTLFEHLSALARQRGVSVIVVEHDVDAVFRFCEQITVLDLGRVVTTGAPAEVRGDERVIAAYLGSAA